MIIAVILAVLAISGGIIYLALRRSIHQDNLLVAPGIVCVTADNVPDLSGQIIKENAHVRS